MRQSPGFTLAELLIALAILGILATFTIPKVLQAQGLQKRYAMAQEILSTVSALTYQYAQENGGCFPGNLTCNINTTTGAPLDGLPNSSTWSTNTGAYNKFAAYLDSHLNYLKSDPPGSRRTYIIGTSSLQLNDLTVRKVSSNKYEVTAAYYLYLDEDLISGDGDYAWVGVDSKTADLIIGAKGTTIGGMNAWNARLGFAYDPYVSSIFDWKEHPNDLCAQYGGDCDK